MANFYTVEKEIRGKKYIAQFNGISAALDAIDNSYIDGTGITSSEKIANHLFSNVLVEPKMSIADFAKEKIGETTEKEINGKKYVAQFKGIPFAVKALDNSYVENTSNMSVKKISGLLLKEVIVEPENLGIDDFETMDELNEVISFAKEAMQGGELMNEFNEIIDFLRNVMEGKFRGEAKDESTAKKKGTK